VDALVLVASVDFWMRRLCRRGLAKTGCDILLARSVGGIFRLLDVAHPDVVILDGRLPGVSDHAVRCLEQRVPVVQVTDGHVAVRSEMTVFVDDFLDQAGSAGLLAEAVARALASRTPETRLSGVAAPRVADDTSVPAAGV
jgi:DNA-binding NtrC family response regulator